MVRCNLKEDLYFSNVVLIRSKNRTEDFEFYHSDRTCPIKHEKSIATYIMLKIGKLKQGRLDILTESIILSYSYRIFRDKKISLLNKYLVIIREGLKTRTTM